MNKKNLVKWNNNGVTVEYYHTRDKEGVSIMLPHSEYNENGVLEKYPAVLMIEDGNKPLWVYCNFDELNEIIVKLIKKEDLGEKKKVLKRTFLDVQKFERATETLDFLNLFDGKEFPSPWEFQIKTNLKTYSKYKVSFPDNHKASNKILHVQVEKGKIVKTTSICGILYATNVISEGYLLSDNSTQWDKLGWDRILIPENLKKDIDPIYRDHILLTAKSEGDNVRLVAFGTKYWLLKGELLKITSSVLNEEDRKRFKKYFKSLEADFSEEHYGELQITDEICLDETETIQDSISRVLYGIILKARENVVSELQKFRCNYLDYTKTRLLEEIPDSLIIRFQDSLDAGNSKYETKEIFEKFPGQAEITALELKKYFGNTNIFRIFKYLAFKRIVLDD